MRLSTNATACSPAAVLTVVPTKPHPPPVPGYYGLSDLEGVPDAYRLVYTYRLGDAGAGFKYTEWQLRRTGEPGRVLLRYAGGKEGEWKWIAVREVSAPGDVVKWVPWYVKRSEANAAVLGKWEIEDADLELIEAKGPVNSEAPGGVQE
ncbi:hypothetical protein B0I37DRAFT_373244 [Chaetomium sp. MPI-CAGE-AT-0009]|nr:hypothetical protein B0I37DRAFT_373244 [Chaetomium sp. MPI-CAGE-AT-0009]